MDTLGGHGFVPFASPNYGGPVGDTASVDLPMIILKKDSDWLVVWNIFYSNFFHILGIVILTDELIYFSEG